MKSVSLFSTTIGKYRVLKIHSEINRIFSFFLSYYVSWKLEEITDAAGLLLGPDWYRRGRSEFSCVLLWAFALLSLWKETIWCEITTYVYCHISWSLAGSYCGSFSSLAPWAKPWLIMHQDQEFKLPLYFWSVRHWARCLRSPLWEKRRHKRPAL